MMRLESLSLVYVDYPFIAIAPRRTLVVTFRVPSMSQMELFNRLLRIFTAGYLKSYGCKLVINIR